MIPSQNEFIKMIVDLAKQELSKGGVESVIQTAKVHSLSGNRVILIFDGENEPSQKAYLKYTSYNPVVGDRVHLLKDIIIGGWRP